MIPMPIQRRDFVTYILLSIITCGIYPIFFWYRFAQDINRVCDGDGDTTTDYIIAWLLSIVTCGIYGFYWYYKLGNRMYNNGPRYGVRINENGTTILLWYVIGMLLCFVGSYIALYYIIRNGNMLFDSYNNYVFGGQGQNGYHGAPGTPGQF